MAMPSSSPSGVPDRQRRSSSLPRPLHVVQVGYDDTVFADAAPSDTLPRQLRYARELERQRPGSQMSVLMFTGKPAACSFRRENALFVPVHATRPHEIPKLYTALASLHRERPIDVIATQSIYQDAWVALLFGWRHGIRVIGQVHNDIFSPIARREATGHGLLGRARHGLGMLVIRRLYAVRVVSQRVRIRMLAEGIHPNVQLMPVPITMAPPRWLGDSEGSPGARVLFVGRLVAEKNLDAWLRVAALVAPVHPEASFDIAGDGPLLAHLRQEAERLGLASRVNFLGSVPYEALPALYRSAAVFLITSHCEGFGRVAVEASLQGVPVVGRRISGIEDIVEDCRTGFLERSGDDRGMANSVARLLSDHALRQWMGKAAHELALARFDPQTLSRSWVSLLVSAAAKSASDPASQSEGAR